MRLDRFLEIEPDTGHWPTDPTIRRHTPAPPEPIIAADHHPIARLPRPHAHPDRSWQDHAACKGQPPEWWIPELHRGDNEATTVTPEAHRLCTTCTVRTACLEYAIVNHEQGFWGGTTTRARARLREQRAAAS